MQLERTELMDSIILLISSADVHERSIGHNYYIEENVSKRRRRNFEEFGAKDSDIRGVAKTYFEGSVQGVKRGHNSSTFDDKVNNIALLSETIDPNQKIIRLERIDRLLSRDPDLTFNRLVDAHRGDRVEELQAFVDLFSYYPGERPSFVAFKSEVDSDLRETDWLTRLIDRMGLYHHYPFAANQSKFFALMEYSVDEVLTQATAIAISRPFAIATVLECQDNPAFFPVPCGTPHGFTVDLRERDPSRPTVREVLHIRFDYLAKHVSRLEQWSGQEFPDIEACRERHLLRLRSDTGHQNFGEWPE